MFVGRLSPLEYYARVLEEADAGMLLDVAHLAITQRALGRAPTDGLDDFPLERVVEVHVAGGREFSHGGRTFIDDDHGPTVLPETWEILARVVRGAPYLRAVVVECERNPLETVLPLFERTADLVGERVLT